MDILIVSATSLELPLLDGFLQNQMHNRNHAFRWLITGVGQVATTYQLMAGLKHQKPDLIIQAGIGGSFQKDYQPGTVVIVEEEVLADLGAIENDNLVDVFDLKLVQRDQQPFSNGVLKNNSEFPRSLALRRVRGATVNAISSTPAVAERIRLKYDVAVESMEGAALHYVCINENIPFVQLRAISNFAGERNKSHWKMKEAIEALNSELLTILSSLNE